MCTIAILHGVTDAPVVLAANRDEMYARPTRSPEQLAPDLVGGVDEISGGSWLVLRRDGRFVAVTNYRAATPPPVGVRSRGLAVTELALADDGDAYLAALDPRAYASMNLVWGDAQGVRVCYCRHATGEKRIERVPRGVHVLCNDVIGAPGFPRGERLQHAIEAALARSTRFADLIEPLARALGDHTHVPEHQVSASDLPPALARELTATCIHSEHYGTRSASLVAIGPTRVAQYLHADGPPCTTRFQDGLPILYGR